jgi:hypothetical protein
MKTLVLISIISLSFMFFSLNTKAGGVDSTNPNLKVSETTLIKISDFAFRLDLKQIMKEIDSVDLSDLTASFNQKPSIKKNEALPFAFTLDAEKIKNEAEKVDVSELK